MRKQTLFLGKSQHLGQQELVLGYGTGTRVLLQNVMSVWLTGAGIPLSPLPKSPDVTPATGRKMSLKEGQNIKQTRFCINCTYTCQSKTKVSYRCSLYRITARNKPLSTKKINLKSYTARFYCSPDLGALLGLCRHPHSPIRCWHFGASKGLHDCMQVQVSWEPRGVYRWELSLQLSLD